MKSSAAKKETLPTMERDIRAIRSRIARVEGQLRGIQRMMDEEADCSAIFQQMRAARRGLDQSFYAMLACSLEHEKLNAQEMREMLSRFA